MFLWRTKNKIKKKPSAAKPAKPGPERNSISDVQTREAYKRTARQRQSQTCGECHVRHRPPAAASACFVFLHRPRPCLRSCCRSPRPKKKKRTRRDRIVSRAAGRCGSRRPAAHTSAGPGGHVLISKSFFKIF